MAGCWWRSLHRLLECDRYRAEIEQTGAGRVVSLASSLRAPAQWANSRGTSETSLHQSQHQSEQPPAACPELRSTLTHGPGERRAGCVPGARPWFSGAESDCLIPQGCPAPPSWPIDLDVLQVSYSWELQGICPINFEYCTSTFSHVLFTTPFTAWDAVHGHWAPEDCYIPRAPALNNFGLYFESTDVLIIWIGIFTRDALKVKECSTDNCSPWTYSVVFFYILSPFFWIRFKLKPYIVLIS